MTSARIEWTLHTPAGALEVLDGSEFGMDTTWSPTATGQLRVRLAEWESTGLALDTSVHFMLECRATPYAATGDLSVPFTSAGAGGWPAAPARRYLTGTSSVLPARSQVWHVYLERGEVDRGAGTVRLSVASFELRLVELVNLGDDWMPLPATSTHYTLEHVALQLIRYAGLDIAVGQVGTHSLPRALMEPWRHGTSAWDWLDRMRVQAGYSVRADPVLDRLTYGPRTPIADDTVPATLPLATWVVQHGGVGASDGLQYADALTVRWTWTDAAGEPAEHRETVYAAGIADWRQVRRAGELELPGPPIAGRAADIVAELRRWRSVAFFTWPLGLEVPTLGAGLAQRWRSLRFAIGAGTTTCTASLIVNS